MTGIRAVTPEGDVRPKLAPLDPHLQKQILTKIRLESLECPFESLGGSRDSESSLEA